MERVPQSLASTTLGDVLGDLHRHRATGVLVIVEPRLRGGRTHRVHLAAGLVHAIETAAAAPRHGDLVRRRGALGGRGAVRFEQALRGGDPRPVGELLVAEGGVPPSALEDALAEQRRVTLDALFAIREATLSFEHPAPLSRHARRAGLLTPRDFLHGRPRMRDRVVESRATALRALGLDPRSTTDDARRAFRRLAAEAHPDRFAAGSAEQRSAAARFAALSAAYHAVADRAAS
jgi:hypothetical protein